MEEAYDNAWDILPNRVCALCQTHIRNEEVESLNDIIHLQRKKNEKNIS